MAETPQAPETTFGPDAEDSAERQKQALIRIIGEQGHYGAQQLRARDAAAQGLQAGAFAAPQVAAAGGMDPATQALYGVFTRDAQQAQTNHSQETQRIQAANQAYMDQVKAAIPMQRADLDAFTNAQRMEYEERQRIREQEAADRAAAAARASASSQQMSILQRALENREADKVISQLDWNEMGPMERTVKAAKAAGAQGGARSLLDAAAAIGMDVDAARRRWVTPDGNDQFAEQDAMLANEMQSMLSEAVQNGGVSWSQVMAAAMDISSKLGFDYKANAQPWLATVSKLWGVEDKDWLQPLAQFKGVGPSGYQSGGGAIYD